MLARASLVAATVCVSVLLAGCERYESLQNLPEPDLRMHYLLDFEYTRDEASGTATMGHLVVFNPGARPVGLDIAIYYEDRAPRIFSMTAAQGTSTEWSYDAMPVTPGTRFALAVKSTAPVIVQATVGWNSTANVYGTGAPSKSPHGPREAALSYSAIEALAPRWYVADGILIDKPGTLWVREDEEALLLNPNNQPATVQMSLFYGWATNHYSITVPPARLQVVKLKDYVVRAGLHYGARFVGNLPIAVQWRRLLYWEDSPELMSFWSLPATPLTTRAEKALPTPIGR